MQEPGLKRRGTAMNENELLADVATKVADMYDAALADPSPPSGAAFGERVANMLAEDWGGINIYIPKGKNRRLRQLASPFAPVISLLVNFITAGCPVDWNAGPHAHLWRVRTVLCDIAVGYGRF